MNARDVDDATRGKQQFVQFNVFIIILYNNNIYVYYIFVSVQCSFRLRGVFVGTCAATLALLKINVDKATYVYDNNYACV